MTCKIDQPKKLQHLSDEQRQALITLVIVKGHSSPVAARVLGLPYKIVRRMKYDL